MIKLLIGGSPCTYWSIAQKNNRETTADGLGWELFKNYLIAKDKFKPDFFLYENNKSAAQAIKDQIKKELNVWDGTLLMEDTGARYIEINSALVSAQNRKRFYVHNCGEVNQPEDRGILLKDILESGSDLSSNEKAYCLTARYNGAVGWNTIERNQRSMVAEPIRISHYSVDGKSVTQSAGGGGMGEKKGLYAVPIENVGVTNREEVAMFAAPHGWNDGLITYDKSQTITTGSSIRQQNVLIQKCEQGASIIKNEKPMAFINKIYEVKDGLITIKGKQYPTKLADGYYIIRKLTVTECARLQTMPDDFCKYGMEIIKQIFNGGNDKWQNAELRDVITKSQTVATDYATSIVYDCKDTELLNLQEKMLIEIKNAKLTVVKENAKATRATVLCTTSGGKDMELSNCLKEILLNAKFAVRMQLQKDCVQSIIKISKNTETQNILIIYEAVLTNMDTKNINTHITKLNIEPLLREYSVDNSQKMILSTILTLISQIMMKATCIYAPKANTVDYIMNLKNVQQNYIEWELLSLKMGIIDLMSASQAYKGLGNGWTAEVIIHILNGALKNVPKDEKIVVLSMYDGIGTGRYCLDKMGFTNVEYHAYEIDKYAIKVAMSNYPDIIQHGDAFALRNDNWSL